MSITYKTVAGDTFELIARKKYGTEKEASRIAKANPGVSEPFTAGVSLVIPDLPSAPQSLPSQLPAASDDEVAILIDGDRFRFWDSVRITRSLDAMDTVEFGAPFDHTVAGMREAFRPFSYKTVAITVGGDLLFTGTMVAVNPVIDNAARTVAVSCYSTPGVLNDCTPPASAFPLEFNGQALNDIATAMADPFGLTVDFQGDAGAVFERVASDPGKKVLSFLTELAQQRKLIIASTERGALLIWAPAAVGSPVARLRQGESPVLSVTPTFSPQEYYSHITGIEPVIIGLAGSQYTVKNPRLQGAVRPLTFNAQDTEGADLKTAVEAKAGRMFGNMVAYSVRVATWRDPNGNLWAPNTTVKLSAPDAMVYGDYEFLIRSVQFERERAAYSATLDLVIPGAFNGEIPGAMPWDD